MTSTKNEGCKVLFVRLDPGISSETPVDQNAEYYKILRTAYDPKLGKQLGNIYTTPTEYTSSLVDIVTQITDWNPNIIHFSGHGSPRMLLASDPSIIKYGKASIRTILEREDFKAIFGTPRGNTNPRVIYISACYAGDFIKEIAKSLEDDFDCMIGMKNLLNENLALELTEILYLSIRENYTLQEIKELFYSVIKAAQKERENRPPFDLLHEGYDPDPQFFGKAWKSIKFDVSLPTYNKELDNHRISQKFVSEFSLAFNGKSSYVDIGNPNVLNFAGQITLEAWIKPENIKETQNILAHGYTFNPHAEVFLRITDGFYQVGSYNSYNYVVTYPIPAEDINSWVHLAGSYDGSLWRLYRNGVELNQSIQPVGAIKVSSSWAIAARGVGNERFFHGCIKEVRIWNRACSNQEISENQFCHIEDSEQGLVGYWPLNEGLGNKAEDRTGRNDGQIVEAEWSKAS